MNRVSFVNHDYHHTHIHQLTEFIASKHEHNFSLGSLERVVKPSVLPSILSCCIEAFDEKKDIRHRMSFLVLE